MIKLYFSVLVNVCFTCLIPVTTPDKVELSAKVFIPKEDIKNDLVIVLVHPYSILGDHHSHLKAITSRLAENGYRAVTFDMRGIGKSTRRASLTGFAEVKDVIAVCNWVSQNIDYDIILLVDSSAAWSKCYIGCFTCYL